MDKVLPIDMVGYDPDSFVAIGVLAGKHSNVRMIRLSPGTSLPPHTHGESDLFLYVAEGGGELDTADGAGWSVGSRAIDSSSSTAGTRHGTGWSSRRGPTVAW